MAVENRPGAGSNIATEFVVKAQSDGYTILAEVLTNVLNTSLYKNLGFNFLRDIAPVSPVANAPYVIPDHELITGQNRSRVYRLCEG